MSGSSTLDPDNFPEAPDRKLGTGHGTGALGPSDTSDSGSDLVGAQGFSSNDILDLGSGTTSDLETGGGSAGPYVGDSNLDSDTDSGGTGERAAAGRDPSMRDGSDIDVDHIESIPSIPLDDDDVAFLNSSPPGAAGR